MLQNANCILKNSIKRCPLDGVFCEQGPAWRMPVYFTIVGEETSANDADNSAVSGQQEPVAESADTATTDPVEESASIKTDANPSTGSDQGLSHSSFPSVSVVTKEHTQTHQPRYVLVFAQELTLSQKFDLKPVIDRFGGFLASYDNLYTFHTAEQAQRCCETIGRM